VLNDPQKMGVCAYGERQNPLPLYASTQLLTPVCCPLQLTYWSQALHGCGRIAAAGAANSSLVLMYSASARALFSQADRRRQSMF